MLRMIKTGTIIFIFSFFLSPIVVTAACDPVCQEGYRCFGSKCIEKATTQTQTQGTTELTNPIGSQNPNINSMIGTVINAALGVVGSIALAMFVYGGAIMMISAGNMERVQKGKSVLIWASIGIVIIFSAYAIVKFVLDGVTGTG